MARTAQIASVAMIDPIWTEVRREAEEAVRAEPALAGFLYATILSKDRLEDAVCHRLAQRLNHSDVDAGLIAETFGSEFRDIYVRQKMKEWDRAFYRVSDDERLATVEYI